MSEKTGLWVPPDGNETLYSTGHHAWTLTKHPRYLQVQDPSFGEFPIGERPESLVLQELIMSPLGLRSAAVAQLSKPIQYGTIPNVYNFFSFGHVISNVGLVDRLSKDHPGRVKDIERLSWMLTVLLTDMAKGPGAHLTDMIIENGMGGPENAHEYRAMEAWKYGGVLDILKEHRIKIDRSGAIEGIATPPWVEINAPDICLERYQYTVEELRLWFESDDMSDETRDILDTLSDTNNLTITEDGKLAFKDPEIALLFSKAYLLLSTEHWNEPVHRVLEYLMIEAFKHAAYSRRLPGMNEYDRGETADIISYTYGVDDDLLHALHTSRFDRDDLMFAISQLLSQLGKEERWRFVEYKREQYLRFLRDPRAEDYPSPILNGHAIDFGPHSSAVETEVIQGEIPELKNSKTLTNGATLIHSDSGGVQYGIQSMKYRYIDPLVMTPKGPRRLSRLNDRYKEHLKQHAAIHASTIIVRLAVSKGYEELIKEGVQSNEDNATIKRPHLRGDQLRWQIDAAARRAKETAQAAGRLVLLT